MNDSHPCVFILSVLSFFPRLREIYRGRLDCQIFIFLLFFVVLFSGFQKDDIFCDPYSIVFCCCWCHCIIDVWERFLFITYRMSCRVFFFAVPLVGYWQGFVQENMMKAPICDLGRFCHILLCQTLLDLAPAGYVPPYLCKGKRLRRRLILWWMESAAGMMTCE